MGNNKAVIIYSGGMDSFTLLNVLHKHGYELAALSVDYGQRHGVELLYADNVCRSLNIPHRVIDLTVLNPLLQGGSSLTTGKDVPEGHYAEANMKATVVPNRNMIMLSIAIGWAVSLGYDRVYTAVHAGDHDIYPDCRPEFVAAMNAVARIANYQEVSVEAPFLNFGKYGILQQGQAVGLTAHDYIRAWTCYNGRDKACGKCGACVERLEAFQQMGWDDPLAYEDKEFFKAALASAGK